MEYLSTNLLAERSKTSCMVFFFFQNLHDFTVTFDIKEA